MTDDEIYTWYVDDIQTIRDRAMRESGGPTNRPTGEFLVTDGNSNASTVDLGYGTIEHSYQEVIRQQAEDRLRRFNPGPIVINDDTMTYNSMPDGLTGKDILRATEFLKKQHHALPDEDPIDMDV